MDPLQEGVSSADEEDVSSHDGGVVGGGVQ